MFLTNQHTKYGQKKKLQKDKQGFTKYTHKTKDRVTPLNTGWTVVGGG
jgi:hypothetical protein